MRKLRLCIALCGFCGSTMFGQGYRAYEKFFLDKLQGKSVEFNDSKKIKPKDLEKSRLCVWNSWKAANAAFDEEKMIELLPLEESKNGKWNLPSELEPNAVMPYYYGSKGSCPSNGFPFFLYLHGSGPKAAEWSTGLKLARYFKDAPSVYFIPQIPNEGAYYRWYQKSKQFAWNKLFRQVLLENQINPNRLYVFGISEGGYGSQRLASFYADYLAAAGPMAGGEPLKNAPAENCRNIGFSLLTGALDKGFYRDVLTTYVKQSFDSLQHLAPHAFEHRVELVPDRAHSIDYSPTTPWLTNFSRNPWPKHISWEDYAMDGVHRKGFYNLVVKERPNEELRTRYDMDIEGNTVSIVVSDVHYKTIQKDPRWGIEMKFSRSYTEATKGNFIVYLNEHLVDLNKKVRVVVNGREMFSGKLKCNTKHMVNSLSVFYDPMRIYPAAVEIHLDEIK